MHLNLGVVMAILVSVNEAAIALSVSKFWLYRAASKGMLPSYRAGKAVRFDMQELLAAMRQRQDETN